MNYNTIIEHLEHLGANKIIVKLYNNRKTIKTTIKKSPSRYFVMITQINYDLYNLHYHINNKAIFIKNRIDLDEFECTLGYIYKSIKNEIIIIEHNKKKV